MYTNTAKNLMLDALAPSHVSAHTAFPGLTGANPVAGARQPIAWNAAANGNLDSSSTPALAIAAAETVRWFGFWDALAAGNFLSCAPNMPSGEVPKLFRVNATTDLIDLPAHGYSDDDKITFFNGTAPGGLTEGTVYFVVGATTDTFQVAATLGGAAIDLTSAGDATVRVARIVEETFGSDGTITLSDADLSLNL